MIMRLERRWMRWVVGGVLGVSLLWWISWAAVPRWVHWQIETRVSESLGRQVRLDEVLFHPGSMTLMLRGLHIAQAGPANASTEPQLSVDEIEINASLQSLFLGAPVADAIVVRNPRWQLTHQGQGRLDIDDVLQRLKSTESTGMPRLSLFNIQVTGGGVQFRDEALSVTHQLTDIRLDVPFLSNIGGRREVATHPRLAFTLNGTAFDTDATTTPFSADRNTHARFQFQGLDVAPFLPYWPAAWPVRLAQGQVELDVTLDFRQRTTPEMRVAGHVALRGLKLNERQARADLPLLEWSSLALKISDWQPMNGQLAIESLSLDKPVVHVRRDKNGDLNLSRLQRFFSPAEPGQTLPVSQGGTWALAGLTMAGGQLAWEDAALDTPVSWALTDLSLEAKDLSWPSPQAASMAGQAQFQGATLRGSGSIQWPDAKARVLIQDVALQSLAPYGLKWYRPELKGQLSAELNLDWRAAASGSPASLVLHGPQIRLRDLALGTADKPEVAWADLALDQVEVDVFRQQARVGRATVTRPVVNLSRNAQGRWMAEDWAIAPTASQAVPASSAAAAAPWQWVLGSTHIVGGTLNLDDRFVAGGAQFNARELNLRMGPWQPGAARPEMTPVLLEFATGNVRREPGQQRFEGAFRLPTAGAAAGASAPLQLQGQLKLNRFPLHRLKAYAADRIRLDLRRADVSYAGGLDLAWPSSGMDLAVQGHLAVDPLQAFQLSDGQALLDIGAMRLGGLDVSVRAGALKHLKVAETAVSDFFARVVLDAQGQLNFQRWVNTDDAAAPTAVDVPAWVALGPMSFVQGRVLFSDHFIRPHYTADITELTGQLGALSSHSREAMADLSLRGRVAGSGRLQVSGRINPLTRPVALTVQGQVQDLELPQLSPYSNKYAGYGIERGKLSADVHYRIGGDGQLEASHQITLKQLRFGERSDRADAPNLPVKLAVALLANRRGEIDLNLPVSGSINDPDFQVGPIVWRMVLNLIGKAIVSPFSLLSGALAGSDQLQHIDFAPGQADLGADALQKLETVAQMVRDKPSLRLTVAGHAHRVNEREAWRQWQLQETVKAEKRRRLLRDGQTAGQAVVVSPQEYPALLQAVYRRSVVPKPLNALGVVKDLTVAQMEALLLATIAVDDSDMRELAQARAQQVRQVLVDFKVPEAQLFLGSPEVSDATTASPWVPQVSLVVSTD